MWNSLFGGCFHHVVRFLQKNPISKEFQLMFLSLCFTNTTFACCGPLSLLFTGGRYAGWREGTGTKCVPESGMVQNHILELLESKLVELGVVLQCCVQNQSVKCAEIKKFQWGRI